LTTECTACNNNYFLQDGTTICLLNSCPVGYLKNSFNYKCEPQEFCYSTCQSSSCISSANKTSCTLCSSTKLSGLTFVSFSGSGSCVPDVYDATYPNIVFFSSIDKSSVLGNSSLKTITKNAIKYSTVNTSVSSLIYNSVNLINFDLLTANSIQFSFVGLGYDHYNIYLRLNAYCGCDGITQNSTLIISVDGLVIQSEVISSTSTLVESNLVPHILNTHTLGIKFGVVNQGCNKFIQDISLYLQKCQDHCTSCPDGGTLLQYGTTTCLSTCPNGLFANAEQTQC
jgi:hypothetical protein